MKIGDCRLKNVLSGRWFGHFGGHIEYANGPNIIQWPQLNNIYEYERLTMDIVDYNQKNVIGREFGHFGGHIESNNIHVLKGIMGYYANEPNFNNF